MPAVSVLMTARDAEAFVVPALESALAQTFADLEIICIDDGSKDATALRAASIGDPRLRIITLLGGVGRTAALNIGLRACRAPFVAVLDADDLAAPDRLERQTAFLRRHPEVIAVGGAYTAIDEAGRGIRHHPMPVSHQEILAAFPAWNPIAHSTMTFRRPAALAVGGYPEHLVWAQDFGLILAMARRGRLANLPETLGSIRLHPRQMTADAAYEATRLLESYLLLRQARYVPGVPEAARAEGRRVCAGLARDYDALLRSRHQPWRRLAFRLGCLAREPFDHELRAALCPWLGAGRSGVSP